MKSIGTVLSVAAVVLVLAACNNDDNGGGGAQSFTDTVRSTASSAPDDTEPMNTDGITVETSDDTESEPI